MPGSVKLRSIKRFGQENSGYEFSDEGEECGVLYTVLSRKSNIKTFSLYWDESIMVLSFWFQLQSEMQNTCKYTVLTDFVVLEVIYSAWS